MIRLIWADATVAEAKSVTSLDFEAVDLSSIISRAGFDQNSAAVP